MSRIYDKYKMDGYIDFLCIEKTFFFIVKDESIEQITGETEEEARQAEQRRQVTKQTEEEVRQAEKHKQII